MIATAVLAALLLVEGLFLGGAKVVGAAGMPQRAAHVGMTASDYRKIGLLEVFAAIGIGIGLAVPAIGVLAAGGLILLLAGAAVAHVRAGDGAAKLVPAIIVASVAAAYLITLLLNR